MFGWKSGVPWLTVILSVALAVRVVAACAVQQVVSRTPGRLCLISGDAEGFWELARHLVQTGEYSVHEPPRRVFRMPGFPLLLAGGMQVVGESPLALRLLLAAVGAGACGLVYRLGMELFDRPTALVACLLAAVSPTFIGLSVLFLSETLFAFAMLLSLIALARLSTPRRQNASTRSPALPLLAGFLNGLATLVHPSWLLVAPAFAGVRFLKSENRRRDALEGALVLAGLALSMLPWLMRNFFVTGHFVLTTLWAGPSLYDGLNPAATGASDMQFVEAEGLYRQRSEYDADLHYRRAAIDFTRRNPGRAIGLALVKVARFWSLVPNAAEFRQPALRFAIGVWTVPFMLAAAAGLWRARRQFWQWFLPAAPVLYFSLIHLVFVGSVRYRLPAEYPLCLLAAAGVLPYMRAGSEPCPR